MAWQRYDSTYIPGQVAAFKISRSKVDLFLDCARCFWLDRRLGIKRPDMPPFQINKAIDELLKKEFDGYRKKQKPHPWMTEIGLDAIPFTHEKLADWRHNFTGVQHKHDPTNFLVFGAIDDVWVRPNGELLVVDYKATAKNKKIVDLDPPGSWHDSYRRQMEVYQWLLRQNGQTVSDTGYFVYANGQVGEKGFHNVVTFVTHTFPYTGNASWVEPTLLKIKACLDGDMPPVGAGPLGQGCSHCEYAKKRTELTLRALKIKTS